MCSFVVNLILDTVQPWKLVCEYKEELMVIDLLPAVLNSTVTTIN
jgi:hypothetical protein